MLWTYETEVGIFWIKPDNNFKFSLGVNETILGSYFTPVSAAEDVRLRTTGHPLWDTLRSNSTPIDLSDWKFYKN